jgi:hypothetical protein
MKNNNVSLMVLAVFMTLVSCTKTANKIRQDKVLDVDGWRFSAEHPELYQVGMDESIKRAGKSTTTINAKDTSRYGYGFLCKGLSAKDYLGKRVRLTGYIRSEDVSQWAGFWMRVDAREEYGFKKGQTPIPTTFSDMTEYACQRPEVLAFDNMHDDVEDRSVHGTSDWSKYEVVLDIPDNAGTIDYGAILQGAGRIWIDDVRLEVVDHSVMTTGVSKEIIEKWNKAPEQEGYKIL